MNCISEPKAMNPNSCSANMQREEKRPQWWGYKERTRRSWYPDTTRKRMIEGYALLFHPQQLTIPLPQTSRETSAR